MASYTPVTLPYFAPAHTLPAPLPTLEEALSSPEFLKRPYYDRDELNTYVARVGEHFIVKYGKAVNSIEGENMLFVKQHTTILVPAVYAMYTYDDDDGEKTMIIMEFIQGLLLNDFKYMLNSESTRAIIAQLRAQVNQLRQIPAPAYYGTLGHRPFTDCYSGRKYGPFDSFADLVDSAFDTAYPPEDSEHLAEVKKFFRGSLYSVATALGHSAPVFTHSDIHEENVVVRPDGTPVIIDYQLAGFYPTYHEYVVSRELNRFHPFLDEEFPREREIIDDAIYALIKADHEHRTAEKQRLLRMDVESENTE
ncbi:kinase-like domain-containing protein [Nemania serpens]|nr:kinase-like domain-containing protein [Nemania serpens]